MKSVTLYSVPDFTLLKEDEYVSQGSSLHSDMGVPEDFNRGITLKNTQNVQTQVTEV